METLNTQFEQFISDPGRRRIYEREALALDAAELISRLMEEKDIRKIKVAEMLGTSKSHVTALLSGTRNFTMHTLADMAFVLGSKVALRAEPLDCVSSSWEEIVQRSKAPNKFAYEYRGSELDNVSRMPSSTAADSGTAASEDEWAYAA